MMPGGYKIYKVQKHSRPNSKIIPSPPPPPPHLFSPKKLQERQPQAKRDFCHCLFMNLVIDQKSKEGIASVKAHKNKQAHNNKCMQQYDGNGEIRTKENWK